MGVHIDRTLSFSPHIATIASKARARCAIFLKSFISRDMKTMLKFYTTYVRPILEYGSVVWCPVSSKDINILENVQRFFTNKITGCTYLPYSQRLSILSLHSLHHRRIVSDLATLHSLVSGNLLLSLTPHMNHTPPSITRGHNLKIDIPTMRYVSSKQNFISRTASYWNSLPLSVLSATSNSSFRHRITKSLFDPHLPSTT